MSVEHTNMFSVCVTEILYHNIWPTLRVFETIILSSFSLLVCIMVMSLSVMNLCCDMGSALLLQLVSLNYDGNTKLVKYLCSVAHYHEPNFELKNIGTIVCTALHCPPLSQHHGVTVVVIHTVCVGTGSTHRARLSRLATRYVHIVPHYRTPTIIPHYTIVICGMSRLSTLHDSK